MHQIEPHRHPAANDGIGPVCPMCGQAAHATKAEVLACSGNRRKEFAELSRLAASIGKPKPREAS